MKRPGGEIFLENKETVLSMLAKDLNIEMMPFYFKDEDFVTAFTQKVPDREEQKKYIINSAKYGWREACDMNYVLFFRRTLPSHQTKPEERWTNEYLDVRNGLKIEIPHGPHRLYSIILCDSLQHLLINGEKKGETNAFTDGEIVVNLPDYDQDTCICKFKPVIEQKALDEYLKTEDAISLETMLEKIKKHKTNLYSSLKKQQTAE